ncbi:MAG: DUF1178 family protein [Sphingomonas sp.]|nr:DUF1178 family protein [Sphingomonas sp.]
MIVFDLCCAEGHKFEAWFASSAAYESQRAEGLINCPCCGCAHVTKAVMAPNIAVRRAPPPEAHAVTPSTAPAPSEAPPAEALLRALAEAQARLLEKSHWVGRDFADRARAMHLGDEPPAAIHGEASLAEARALVDEGVPILPLPLPVVPPEALN